MKGLRTKAAYIGPAVNYDTRGSYETGNSDDRKIWHSIPHVSTKGGRNKSRSYTSKYAPGTDRNTTSER